MKCIVVDDLPIARKGMARLISLRPELELIASYESAEQALLDIENKNIDLAFIDIRMSGMSGMQLAQKITPDIMVVFTTAFSDYAVESYDINAVDYLLKPIDPDKFNRAVDKAFAIRRSREVETDNRNTDRSADDFITIKADRRYIRIKYEDIRFVEGLKNTVIFHLENNTIVSRSTLKAIFGLLPSTNFIQVNKSFIVNKDKISSFNNQDIFIEKQEISIGPKFREDVMKYLLG